ncbi:MAG: SRPBCC family protein [Bacteroidia bacterium]|nr:SRPBCC family protein [Bacteroidia bacterium]
MKIFKKILVGIAILGLVLVVASNFLPSSYSVTRELTLGASPERVYEAVSNLETWEKWATFSLPAEPNATIIYGDTTAGAGARKKWSLIPKKEYGEKQKEIPLGWIRIKSAEKPARVTFSYTMDAEEHLVDGEILLTKVSENETKVSWTFSGNFRKQPFEKYLGLWIDSLLGKRISETLEKLNDFCQK